MIHASVLRNSGDRSGHRALLRATSDNPFVPHPHQACVNCHFFVKELVSDRTAHQASVHVTVNERAQARAGDYSWDKDHWAISCAMGVWHQGYEFDASQRHRLIVEQNRKNFCFFWHFRPGMFLQAGKVLQEREAADRAASRDRRLTLYGLAIAAAALVVNTYVNIAKELHWWPF